MEVSVKHKAHNNTAMIKTVNRYIPQREGYKVCHHLIPQFLSNQRDLREIIK